MPIFTKKSVKKKDRQKKGLNRYAIIENTRKETLRLACSESGEFELQKGFEKLRQTFPKERTAKRAFEVLTKTPFKWVLFLNYSTGEIRVQEISYANKSSSVRRQWKDEGFRVVGEPFLDEAKAREKIKELGDNYGQG
ncbi:hypothetical protein ACFL35_21060 [Candidatus Riflebacteria bacterium]